MARRWWVMLAGLVGLVGVVSSRRGRRAVRRTSRWCAQRARYVAGEAHGAGYRLAGRHPAEDVDPATLADRVRSVLGPLEKRLDLPRVHVMAEDHVILLHGVVGSERDADDVEQAVRRVPGVTGVESYLHVGLLAGDTRPSRGHLAEQPSEALLRLRRAAREAGANQATDTAIVRAVLATLVARLPGHQREKFLSHLPGDVRTLAQAPRRHGQATRLRHVAEFVDATGVGSMVPGDATRMVESVLGVLRQLVPTEVDDVAAVLPGELKGFWRSAMSVAGRGISEEAT